MARKRTEDVEMTFDEAVLRANKLLGGETEKGSITAALSELDLRAQIDIFGKEPREAKVSGELFLPSPYDEAYIYYAAAKVNFDREEFELYNNNLERAMELFDSYARLYNRKRQGQCFKVRNLW